LYISDFQYCVNVIAYFNTVLMILYSSVLCYCYCIFQYFVIVIVYFSAVLLNVLGVIILVTVTSLAGIVMFAYYAQKGCDPLTSDKVSNSNQLIPYFVMEVLGYPGLPGLFISCLFSGAHR
jgi:uncharacterized membrane-anchored protein